MDQIAIEQIRIADDFWGPRLQVNAEKAIFHQWQQLEKTGCIENFRLVVDGADGFREGYFFADSDAFKWLDAAARVYASYPSEKLKTLIDDFITLIERAQEPDGYIYTYNQLLFSDVRWINLQIEHELYCHGHLIEAGVSHFEATGERRLLDLCTKTADLLVREFAQAPPEGTPGHPEIEIALIRLYRVTQNEKHLDLAEHFIEQRGKIKGFFGHIMAQNKSMVDRSESVSQRHAEYVAEHPEHTEKFQLPADNTFVKPSWGLLRFYANTGTGKYFQQHKSVRKQTVPVGHSVRFTYLETAIAMLYQHKPDDALLNALQLAWDHMVARRMYVTGGIGSLPNIEGFGRDYELDPAYSYAETCAALGNIFWSWEKSLITREAKYADLIEWQLYNAAAVGLGQDGISYAYNNPLYCDDGLSRQEWFKCPCCPSNLSRVWADLGKYIYSFTTDQLWVHQYIGNQVDKLAIRDGELRLKMETELPWGGKVKLTLDPEKAAEFTIHCRVPSWTSGLCLSVNGEDQEIELPPMAAYTLTASGYDPRESWYLPIQRTWNPGDVLEIEFEMAINVRATHPKVKSTQGQVAVTYGPHVYCLESVDNPKTNIFVEKLDPASLHTEFDGDLFDGITILCGQTIDGSPLTFIPYYLWANRGESKMTVYVNV